MSNNLIEVYNSLTEANNKIKEKEQYLKALKNFHNLVFELIDKISLKENYFDNTEEVTDRIKGKSLAILSKTIVYLLVSVIIRMFTDQNMTLAVSTGIGISIGCNITDYQKLIKNTLLYFRCRIIQKSFFKSLEQDSELREHIDTKDLDDLLEELHEKIYNIKAEIKSDIKNLEDYKIELARLINDVSNEILIENDIDATVSLDCQYPTLEKKVK